MAAVPCRRRFHRDQPLLSPDGTATRAAALAGIAMAKSLIRGKISHFVTLCENSVHDSTGLTTNGIASFEIKHLAVRPETCMMDVEAHHECSIAGTMVEILAIESRRHFDGKPNIYTSGLRCICGTGRRQEKHLGDLYGSSRIA